MDKEPLQSAENGSLQSTKAGASQPKAFEIMSPLVVLCWECQEGGMRAGGQWCSWITTRRWDQCTGCTGRWMQSLLKCSAPSNKLSLRPSCVSSGKLSVPQWFTLISKGSSMGCGGGEMQCIGPKAKYVDFVDRNVGRIESLSRERNID